MEKGDKGSTMIWMGVSGWMFLLVPAYPGCPRSKAVKRSSSLLLLYHKVSNVLNMLVSREKPGFYAPSKGLIVLLCMEVVCQGLPDHEAIHSGWLGLGCSGISWIICKTMCTLLQTDNHTKTSSVNFYRLVFFLMMPYQQRQSTEGNRWHTYIHKYITLPFSTLARNIHLISSSTQNVLVCAILVHPAQ